MDFVVTSATKNFHVLYSLLSQTLVGSMMYVQIARRLFIGINRAPLADIPAQAFLLGVERCFAKFPPMRTKEILSFVLLHSQTELMKLSATPEPFLPRF